MRTVETINAIIMALFFLCYSYQFVYLAIGLFAKPKKAEAAAPHRRIAVLIAARNEARKQKNWAEADRIRDVLKAQGIVLEDTPQGVKWHRA